MTNVEVIVKGDDGYEFCSYKKMKLLIDLLLAKNYATFIVSSGIALDPKNFQE